MDSQNLDLKEILDPPRIPAQCSALRENLQCAICFLYLRNPVLTICGHRFCEECLSKWINERDRRCPIDNNPLSEKDVFPDNYTKREIASLTVVCPNDGCSMSVPLIKFEDHYDTCEFSPEKVEGKEHKCLYEKLGCNFKTSMVMDLSKHQAAEVIKHTQLLLLEMNKLSSFVNSCQCNALQEEYMEHLKGKFPSYMKDVYEKLTELDQRTRECSIEISNTSSQLQKCVADVSALKLSMPPEIELRNGKLLWELKNFNEVLGRLQNNPEGELSSAFYTSEMGYRFRMRLKLSGDEPTLGIFFHLVRGPYDALLKWPFIGEITISVIHPVDSPTRKSVMKTNGSEAFQRPKLDFCTMGYGFTKAVTLKELFENGYIYDDKLVILGCVRSFNGE